MIRPRSKRNDRSELPFYARFALVLLSVSLVLFIVWAGSNILLPLILATVFAIILRPVVVLFHRKLRFPMVLSALVSVFLLVVIMGGIIAFIGNQVLEFMHDLPEVRRNLAAHYHHLQDWVMQKFNISYLKQEQYVESITEDSLKDTGKVLGDTITFFSAGFLGMILIPVYIFLILLYHDLFLAFLVRLAGSRRRNMVAGILQEVKAVMHSYVLGLATEIVVVACLSTGGLLIIGAPYPILLGAITGVFNLIPYVGVWAAGAISVLAVLVYTTNIKMIVGVILVISAVQVIDNNFIVPRLVASKVKVNALASIVGVFVGGALGGVLGMFLAIPVIAIMKSVFDRTPGLHPWGILFGDTLHKKQK